MKTKPQSKDLIDFVVSKYKQGTTLSKLKTDYDVPYHKSRKILLDNNVPVVYRWTKKEKQLVPGNKFGRWEVIQEIEERGFNGQKQYLCKCECGIVSVVLGAGLRTGHSKSCGCLKIDLLSIAHKKFRKPYESLYNILKRTAKNRNRTLDLSYEQFKEFTNQKQCFYCDSEIIWTEYISPEKRTTAYNLDRIDNSKGYSKENCVVACSRCNKSRSDLFTFEEWVKIGNVIKTFRRDNE